MIKLNNKKDGSLIREIDQLRISVGRDSSNDIVLDDDRISGFHAKLFFENDILACVDLGSSNGTLVNGEPIQGRVELKAWDQIRLGDIELEVVDIEARRPTQEQPAVPGSVPLYSSDKSAPVDADAYLKLVSLGGFPSEVPLSGVISIGRTGSNDLALNIDTVSSKHAEISVSGSGIQISDLGSSNGTFVNGQKIQSRYLKHGDRVKFDEVEYRVDIPGQDLSKTTGRPAIDKTMVRHSLSDEDIDRGKAKGPAATSSHAERVEINRPVDTSPTVVAPAVEPLKSDPDATIVNQSVNDSMLKDSSPKSDATTVVAQPSVKAPPPPPLPQKGSQQKINKPVMKGQIRNVSLTKLLFSYEGRINRMTYILTSIALTLIEYLIIYLSFVVTGASITVDSINQHGLIVGIFFLYTVICLLVKRIHDTDRSGHFLWLILIPFVNLYALTVVLFFKGSEGANRFGSQPADGFGKEVT